MAATYGYSGEFSSDEDIDRMEQPLEDDKLTKTDVEQAIRILRRTKTLDIEDDELLAAILDYYKTARGPIVNSTRGLYRKIALRLIHGEQPGTTTNGDNAKEAEDKGENNNNEGGKGSFGHVVDDPLYSSDDEPMSQQNTSPFSSSQDSNISRAVVNNVTDKPEPMEVDSEPTALEPTYRAGQESGEESGSELDEQSESSGAEDEEETSDSEVVDVTPVKKPSETVQKPLESVKKQPARQNLKQQLTDTQKKPYTRSQRVAATRAGSAIKSKMTDVSSSRADGPSSEGVTSATTSDSTQRARALAKKIPGKFLVATIFVAIVASLLYFLKSDLNKLTDRVVPKSFKF